MFLPSFVCLSVLPIAPTLMNGSLGKFLCLYDLTKGRGSDTVSIL